MGRRPWPGARSVARQDAHRHVHGRDAGTLYVGRHEHRVGSDQWDGEVDGHAACRADVRVGHRHGVDVRGGGTGRQLLSATAIAPTASAGVMLTLAVGAAAVPSVTNTAYVATSGDYNAANNVATDGPTVVAGVVDIGMTLASAGPFTVGQTAGIRRRSRTWGQRHRRGRSCSRTRSPRGSRSRATRGRGGRVRPSARS